MHLPARDAELVQIMDASLAESARRAGAFLACRVGCTQCCHGAFAINALDAARLRAGMTELRATNPSLAAEIERRARAWLAEYGPLFPGDRNSGALGNSVEDQARFEDFADDAACPALDTALRCAQQARTAPRAWGIASSASSAPRPSRSPPAKCPSRKISRRSCSTKSARQRTQSSPLPCFRRNPPPHVAIN